MATLREAGLIQGPPLFDPLHRQARGQDRDAEAATLRERGGCDDTAPDRWPRLLHRPGPQLGDPQVEIFPFVNERCFAPRSFQYLDRFFHARAAVVAAQTVTNEFVFVVDATFA